MLDCPVARAGYNGDCYFTAEKTHKKKVRLNKGVQKSYWKEMTLTTDMDL